MCNCKMSVTIGGFDTNGHHYDVCAINTKVRCKGNDDDKKQCPFWNNNSRMI